MVYASFGINSTGGFLIEQQQIEQVNIYKHPEHDLNKEKVDYDIGMYYHQIV